ncbi:leukocyte tyrosine kinase receptor-like [Montipora capricornis]|uniref:leukocyte tyrosine kinase receptor-like n=1 Tax=Montipora capricornis TaxID=246305 RepID=UPI0035F11583
MYCQQQLQKNNNIRELLFCNPKQSLFLWISGLLFLFTPVRLLQWSETATSRSSTFSITENHVLKGYVIQRQQSYDFLSCAHLCLTRSGCASVNYENVRNGICELNGHGSSICVTNALIPQPGYLFGLLLPSQIVPGGKYIFTTLGARGRTGPTSTAGYKGTSLESQVILDKGIQIWTVPVTGTYVIEASGASGANGTCAASLLWKLGGLGAKITGTFPLVRGTQLKVLVGQEGGTIAHLADRPGGGGGGSFVTLMDDSPLIIAGGGGGGGTARDNFKDGDPGQATRNGSQCGGTQGGGGQVCNAQTGKRDPSFFAGGGARVLGNGESGLPIGKAPLSFRKGGTGVC